MGSNFSTWGLKGPPKKVIEKQTKMCHNNLQFMPKWFKITNSGRGETPSKILFYRGSILFHFLFGHDL